MGHVGPLNSAFKEICEVKDFNSEKNKSKLDFIKIFKNGDQTNPKLRKELLLKRFDLIYVNTIASSDGGIWAKNVLNIPLITHIHELQYSLELYSSQKNRLDLLEISEKIIACSEAVKDNLVNNYVTLASKIIVIHSFIDENEVNRIRKESKPVEIKNEFGIPLEHFLVGACGNAEWRKGLDVFVNLALQALEDKNPLKLHFVWIGLKPEGSYYEQIMYDVRKMELTEFVTFIKPTSKAIDIIDLLDVFVVSSREDPFPLVMLEAAFCQKPILGFKNTGGCSEFVKNEAGILSPYLDVVDMATNLKILAENETLRKTFGINGQNQILHDYNFEQSALKLEKELLSLI